MNKTKSRHSLKNKSSASNASASRNSFLMSVKTKKVFIPVILTAAALIAGYVYLRSKKQNESKGETGDLLDQVPVLTITKHAMMKPTPSFAATIYDRLEIAKKSHSKMTVLFPHTKVRSSATRRTALASTETSTSLPARFISSTL
jgi:hypothetical protein